MQRSHRIYFSILILCLAAHIAVVSSVTFQQQDTTVLRPFFYDSLRPGPGADFFALYHAGVNIRRGVNPYDKTPDGITPFFFGYRYLPALAYLAQPLTWMSPAMAFLMWILCLEILLFYFIYLLYQKMKNTGWFLLAASSLLLSTPFFLEVYMGQFTFVATVLCLIALMKAKPVSKGIYLALSIFLKPHTIIAMPAFLGERKGLVTVIAASVAVLVSVPIFLLHPDQWESFFGPNMNPIMAAGVGNYGLIELLHMIFQNLHIDFMLNAMIAFANIFRWVILVPTVLLVLFSKAPHILKGGVLLLAHFVSYSHTWEHHMSGVCAIAALLLCCQNLPRWFYAGVSICLVALALPTPFYFFFTRLPSDFSDPSLGWPSYALYMVVISKVLPTLALYILTLVQLFDHKRRFSIISA